MSELTVVTTIAIVVNISSFIPTEIFGSKSYLISITVILL